MEISALSFLVFVENTSCTQRQTVLQAWGGGTQQILHVGGGGCPLPLLFTILDRKGTCVVYLSLKNGKSLSHVPCLETCTPF